jgi:Chaperone for flagella basal body P-ring formation
LKTITKFGLTAAALILLSGAALQTPAFATELNTLTLKAVAQVAADEVTLHDLVVGDGSSYENIVICHSPLIGTVRTLSKAEIATLLKKSDDEYLLSGPEQIRVTRIGRKISAEDLRPLIEAELKTRNSKAAIQDIQLQATIFVTDVDGLKLRKLRFDSAINKYRAWFVASDAPHAVIFEAMATLDHVSHKNIVLEEKKQLSALPVVVHRGKTAMMQLDGEGFSAMLLVTCLEDGRASGTIRVREQASKQKYRAEVLGPGQLRAISREN